jgi:hypothetical protein
MRRTARGESVNGTGENGTGIATCAASAIRRLAAMVIPPKRVDARIGKRIACAFCMGVTIPRTAPSGKTEKQRIQRGARVSKIAFVALAAVGVAIACAKPTPLTAAKAESLIRSHMFKTEPVYAEVPQRVSFGPSSPKDDYDELAIRTLKNLEKAGLVTLAETHDPPGTTTYVATVTKEGFTILGTIPSARGPAFRARIAEKKLSGVQNFERHPTQETVGRAEVVWHYVNPTPYYDLFETKINKPLNKPFVSLVSFYWKKGWRFDVTVRKTEPQA